MGVLHWALQRDVGVEKSSCPGPICHHHSHSVCPQPFFWLGETGESASTAKSDLLCTHGAFRGLSAATWLCTGGCSLRANRDGSATGQGQPKTSFPPCSPTGPGAVPADPQKCWPGAGSSPLRRAGRTPQAAVRGPTPEHPSSASPGTTAGPQQPPVAKHQHHFTLYLSTAACSSLPIPPQNETFPLPIFLPVVTG